MVVTVSSWRILQWLGYQPMQVVDVCCLLFVEALFSRRRDCGAIVALLVTSLFRFCGLTVCRISETARLLVLTRTLDKVRRWCVRCGREAVTPCFPASVSRRRLSASMHRCRASLRPLQQQGHLLSRSRRHYRRRPSACTTQRRRPPPVCLRPS